ncbi:MAG: hypothetical protein A3I05_04750 [Deltaproteobacteria bacterium RIFCSPLOWO2_02_FULL_44_10]|nr:MAG: hypothetical protein A3C46_08835 [Deltaproteobacteria bacterium RIFCSPHIGHO2_02_FULL_44_16]OGQ47017.1 MAG: hypothetical protein A3I05_04750 [Deltaproteobacteria bacterium RIFCSPLOWO2_02_FULL_44_10]
MAEEFDRTDLLDIDEGTPTSFEEAPPKREIKSTPRPRPQSIAPLKDRFVAAFIDGYLFLLFYFILGALYRGIAMGTAFGPIPVWGFHGILLHSLFLLLTLLGYVLFEGVLLTTPGKWLCRLRVQHLSGGVPPFRAIFLRNLLRPLDLLLIPLFFGVVLLEKMSWHQRFGDLAAQTVVIQLAQDPRVLVQHPHSASASGRTGAFLFDFLLFGAFAFGYSLLLSPEAPLTSQFLLLLGPLLALLFFMLPLWLSHSSPGKWLFGYIVTHEDGSRINLASAFTRTLYLLIDFNPFGLLCLLISPRHQRFGDTAASTMIVVDKRKLRGLIGLVVMLVLSGVIVLTGQENRDNFLSPSFRINFLPSLDLTKEQGIQRQRQNQSLSVMRIQNVRFYEGSPHSPQRTSANFYPGEIIYLVFEVDGYALEENQVWLKEDVTIRYPDASVALKLEEIIDFHKPIEKAEPIEFSNKLVLPKTAPPGRYTVTIAIRDVLSKRKLTQQRFFYVIVLNE